jgi:hypothetical protein
VRAERAALVATDGERSRGERLSVTRSSPFASSAADPPYANLRSSPGELFATTVFGVHDPVRGDGPCRVELTATVETRVVVHDVRVLAEGDHEARRVSRTCRRVTETSERRIGEQRSTTDRLERRPCARVNFRTRPRDVAAAACARDREHMPPRA